MEAEKIKIPDIFSKELVVFLFIIEEIEKNNIVTYRDIIDYTCWVRHTVERIVTNLIDMNFIELSKFCPYCNYFFKNHIPQTCEHCSRVILPNCESDVKTTKLPKFIIQINRQNEKYIKEDLYKFAEKIINFSKKTE